MTRTGMLLVAACTTLTSAVARADDPPCKAEADAVRAMKERDPALAYPKDSDAIEHNERARRAFGVQDYETAIKEYTAAGLEDSAPLILYNLAQTYRAAKDYEKAIVQYRRFIDRGKPGAEVRALVECHIRQMTAEMEHAASTAPPSGPPPDADGEPSGEAPVEEPLPAAGSGRDESATVEHAPSRWTAKRWIAVGLGGLAVAAAGGGVAFGLASEDLKTQAQDLCPSSPCENAEEANRLGERADARATLANVSFASSAVLVVSAAVLWYVGGPSSSSPADGPAAVVPSVTPTSAGLVFTKRF